MRVAPAVWLPSVIWALAILIFSLLPLPFRPPDNSDKIAHALAYAVLAFLLRRALVQSRLTRGQAAALAVAVAVAYGTALEAVQSLLVYRKAEVLDLLANTVGALTAAVPLRREPEAVRRPEAARRRR